MSVRPTPRELGFLRYIAEGMSAPDLAKLEFGADNPSLSHITASIDSNFAHVRRKFGVRNQDDAIRWLKEHGFDDGPEDQSGDRVPREPV